MTFPEGILGFPNDRRFILLEHGAEGSPFKWLQSIDSGDLAFIVLDPTELMPEYQAELDVDSSRMIKTSDPLCCAVMVIVNVPQDHPIRMTANMKAPLIVNVEERLGRQIVQGSQAYAMNMPIFPTLNERKDKKGDVEKADTAPNKKKDTKAGSSKS